MHGEIKLRDGVDAACFTSPEVRASTEQAMRQIQSIAQGPLPLTFTSTLIAKASGEPMTSYTIKYSPYGRGESRSFKVVDQNGRVQRRYALLSFAMAMYPDAHVDSAAQKAADSMRAEQRKYSSGKKPKGE